MNEDRATRFYRLKRRASMVSLVLSVPLLGTLGGKGLAVALRSVSQAVALRLVPAAAAAATAVAVYVVVLSAINEVGGLLIAFYRDYVLERRYALSNERFGSWVLDQAKSFAVQLTLAVIAAS